MPDYERNIRGCINRKDDEQFYNWIKRAKSDMSNEKFCAIINDIYEGLNPGKDAVFIEKLLPYHKVISPTERDYELPASNTVGFLKGDTHVNPSNNDDYNHNQQIEDAVQVLEPLSSLPSFVSTGGSGPYEENVFDELLERLGITVFEINNTDIDVLVLGQRDWNEELIFSHIYGRSGESLKVYSQEMFLAFIATKEDPYESSSLLASFGQNHPALDYIIERGFNWAESPIVPYHQVEMLKFMGYLTDEDDDLIDVDALMDADVFMALDVLADENALIDVKVFMNGPIIEDLDVFMEMRVLTDEPDRRIILDNLIQKQLPKVMSASYMEKWGGPETSLRLEMLANTIFAYRTDILQMLSDTVVPCVDVIDQINKVVKFNKKIDIDTRKKLADLEENLYELGKKGLTRINILNSDLEWLKENYYLSGMTFKWPETTVLPSTNKLPAEKIDWPQEGLLSVMGYHVGKNGADIATRHKILKQVVLEEIPNVKSVEHMQEWDEPDTSDRLKKLANAIASFTRNAKRRKDNSRRYAIDDWESDLAWLKGNYYDNKYDHCYGFDWPST